LDSTPETFYNLDMLEISGEYQFPFFKQISSFLELKYILPLELSSNSEIIYTDINIIMTFQKIFSYFESSIKRTPLCIPTNTTEVLDQ